MTFNPPTEKAAKHLINSTKLSTEYDEALNSSSHFL